MFENLDISRRSALRATGGVIAGSAMAGVAAAESASIVATDTTPATGQNVTFEAANYNPDSSYEQYNWSIEDSNGNFIASGIWGKTIDFTFDAADTYTVYLIASSDYDGSKATAQIDVSVDERVEIEPSTENPSTGEQVTFEATEYVPNSDYEQYNWSIEDADGNFVASNIWGQSIDYTFSERGVYTVYVIAASDYSGDRATDSIKIGV